MKYIKKLIVVVFYILFVFNADAKIPPDSITSVQNFSIDGLNNVYILRRTEILKTDSTGKILIRTSSRELGSPSIVDTRDPLRLLIFYPDFAMIRVLDNQLADQSTIDLRIMGYVDPRLICGSFDQGIWIFDQTTNRLSKLDVRLQKVSLTLDLNQLLGKNINANAIEQSQQWIALRAGKEAFIFDQFGTYVRTISLNYEPCLFQLREDELRVGTSGNITSYSLKYFNSVKEDSCPIPVNTKKAVQNNGRLWILKDDILYYP